MALAGYPGMAAAQETPAPDATLAPETEAVVPAPVLPEPPTLGATTKRQLPRYVSLKGQVARARRGPGSDHRVDWVYQRPGLPMKVTAEFEHWRRVEDPEGAGGWMHYALLSQSRTVMVTEDMVEFRNRPDPNGSVIARAEAGVIGRLLECRIDWCRVSSGGTRGWLPKTAVWGVEPHEIID